MAKIKTKNVESSPHELLDGDLLVYENSVD